MLTNASRKVCAPDESFPIKEIQMNYYHVWRTPLREKCLDTFPYLFSSGVEPHTLEAP